MWWALCCTWFHIWSSTLEVMTINRIWSWTMIFGLQISDIYTMFDLQIILHSNAKELARSMKAVMSNPDQLLQIARNGYMRMGQEGASRRISQQFGSLMLNRTFWIEVLIGNHKQTNNETYFELDNHDRYLVILLCLQNPFPCNSPT